MSSHLTAPAGCSSGLHRLLTELTGFSDELHRLAAEVLSQRKLPDSPPATGNTVAQGDPPQAANRAAWRTGLADPLARWSF